VTVFAVLAAASPLRAQPLIELLSVGNRGFSAEGRSNTPDLNHDGTVAAFGSDAVDLIAPRLELPRDQVYARVRADENRNERITVGINGPVNGPSQAGGFAPSLSGDAQFVAFSSSATNLVPDDQGTATDVFVFDRVAQSTQRVSIGMDGEANGTSSLPRLDDIGGRVVFVSAASNLVPSDDNDLADIFVFDRDSGQTRRVSVSSSGEQANGASRAPAISDDGRVIAFVSSATNLVAQQTGGVEQVYVHDLESGETALASVSSTGDPADRTCFLPALNADGLLVAFKSEAINLIGAGNDTNGVPDVFVHSRASGVTERVSVDSFGNQSNGLSGGPAISGDGRFVSFISFSSTFDPDDGNGFSDVFVFDRDSRQIARVSIAIAGSPRPGGDVPDFPTSMSADGRWIGFASAAENLVEGDINNTIDAFAACNPFDPRRCDVDPNPTPTPTAGPTACVGDCDLNLIVNINEIVRMTNIALGVNVCGEGPVLECLAGDANGDCLITIDEIVQAVLNSLDGCKNFGIVPIDELIGLCCRP
jgi:Tol biopolymer transport system component